MMPSDRLKYRMHASGDGNKEARNDEFQLLEYEVFFVQVVLQPLVVALDWAIP